ncbi:hypothetical protein FACS1894174_09750 [Bacteroidia bacterium]|nr:hypothetical protein FACS1894174_09750 [Bacteroidia bacterium]
MENNEIRAVFDDNSIIVYQAYRKEIALPAIENQKFVSPFKMDRMTWIKPSFLWMMFRSGWATKEDQECILSIKMKRDGFDWAIKNGCLSHFDKTIYGSEQEWRTKMGTSSVRIQWDPEKDIYLNNLPYRSIQIGLSGIAVKKYVDEWIISIKDITNDCKILHDMINQKRIDEVKELLPHEKIYPQSPFSTLSDKALY